MKDIFRYACLLFTCFLNAASQKPARIYFGDCANILLLVTFESLKRFSQEVSYLDKRSFEGRLSSAGCDKCWDGQDSILGFMSHGNDIHTFTGQSHVCSWCFESFFNKKDDLDQHKEKHCIYQLKK